MTTQTLLDWFTVLALFALLVAPAALGHAKDRRIDRQLKHAAQSPLTAPGHTRPAPASRAGFSRAA